LRALAEAIKTKKKVLIFEDGGYLNPLIDTAIDKTSDLTIAEFRKQNGILPEPATDQSIGHQKLADAVKAAFVGTCELTRNGYNATQSLYEYRAANNSGVGYLNTRFASIAASYWKTQREGNDIALACMNGLAQVLYSIGWTMSMRSVCVLGARGNLGRLFCKYLSDVVVEPSKMHSSLSSSNRVPAKGKRLGSRYEGLVDRIGRSPPLGYTLEYARRGHRR